MKNRYAFEKRFCIHINTTYGLNNVEITKE